MDLTIKLTIDDVYSGYHVDSKLNNIYQEMVEKAFPNPPIDCGGPFTLKEKVVRNEDTLGLKGDSYGWELHKTPNGTAIIEYYGNLQINEKSWEEEGRLNLAEVKGIRNLDITFHQSEENMIKWLEKISSGKKLT